MACLGESFLDLCCSFDGAGGVTNKRKKKNTCNAGRVVDPVVERRDHVRDLHLREQEELSDDRHSREVPFVIHERNHRQTHCACEDNVVQREEDPLWLISLGGKIPRDVNFYQSIDYQDAKESDFRAPEPLTTVSTLSGFPKFRSWWVPSFDTYETIRGALIFPCKLDRIFYYYHWMIWIHGLPDDEDNLNG